MDPFNKESDEVLWAALEKVQMDEAVRCLPSVGEEGVEMNNAEEKKTQLGSEYEHRRNTDTSGVS